MFKLSEKFGWTEKQILDTSYKYITAILKITRIEYDYNKWKKEKNDDKRFNN